MPELSRNTRIGLAVGVAAAAAAAALVIVPGTFGGFTSEPSNPGNEVITGTLRMTNSAGNGVAIISESLNPGSGNLQPGDDVTSTVSITNSGTLPAAIALGVDAEAAAAAADDLATQLTLVITDLGDDGVAGGTDDSTVVNESLRAADDNTYDLGEWDAGEAHTFEVTLQFADSAGNAYQGETATFALNWAGAQTS